PGATWRPDETYRRLTSVRLETVSLVQTSEDRRPDATSGEKRPGVSSHGVPLHSSASDEADVSAPSADCSEDAEKAVDDCEDPPQERHLAKTSDELGRLRLVGDPAGRLACLAHGSAGYRTLLRSSSIIDRAGSISPAESLRVRTNPHGPADHSRPRARRRGGDPCPPQQPRRGEAPELGGPLPARAGPGPGRHLHRPR